jgi:hypothetical protein
MNRRNNILDFRRRHRIEKPPKRPEPQKRKIGGLYDRFVGTWYWPHGLRTWMLITGLGPIIVLGIAWLCGWRSDWI